MIHELKILKTFYDAIIYRTKTFEIRKNDRGFHIGDTLILKPVNDSGCYLTGYKAIECKVTFVLTDWGLKDGYVALGIELLERKDEKIIHCKDCVHCSKYDCWTENGRVILNSCWNDKGMFNYVLDNDYCSRGYRKEITKDEHN